MKTIFTFCFAAFASLLSGQGLITGAEFFIDNDPGYGNATSVSVAAGASIVGSAAIPIESTDPGLHVIALRTKNSEGRWSLYVRKNFYVFPSNQGIDVVEAEYYFDEDPGAGNGTTLPVTPAENVALETAVALPPNLPKGLHSLQIRVKDSSGKWSLYARRMFFYTNLGEVFDIVDAEYFIDEDPGVGEALPLSIAPAPNLDQVVDIPLPETISEGDHMLYIRVLREDEKWSLYAAHPFVIDLSAGTRDHAAALSVYPNPTADVLQIEVAGMTVSSVVVYDMQGKTVMAEPFTDGSVSLSRLGKGTYLVQLRFGDGQAVSKRIVVM